MISRYDFILGSHVMISWYDLMIWSHDMISWYDLMIWSHLRISWYDLMIWSHLMIRSHAHDIYTVLISVTAILDRMGAWYQRDWSYGRLISTHSFPLPWAVHFSSMPPKRSILGPEQIAQKAKRKGAEKQEQHHDSSSTPRRLETSKSMPCHTIALNWTKAKSASL